MQDSTLLNIQSPQLNFQPGVFPTSVVRSVVSSSEVMELFLCLNPTPSASLIPEPPPPLLKAIMPTLGRESNPTIRTSGWVFSSSIFVCVLPGKQTKITIITFAHAIQSSIMRITKTCISVGFAAIIIALVVKYWIHPLPHINIEIDSPCPGCELLSAIYDDNPDCGPNERPLINEKTLEFTCEPVPGREKQGVFQSSIYFIAFYVGSLLEDSVYNFSSAIQLIVDTLHRYTRFVVINVHHYAIGILFKLSRIISSLIRPLSIS
jgi:hypothetical protein